MPKAFLALTIWFVGVLAPVPSRAFDVDLVSVGIRASVSSERVLGDEQPDAFNEYGAWAAFRLPWQSYRESGWGVGTRLLTSAGYFEGGGRVRWWCPSSLWLPSVPRTGDSSLTWVRVWPC